jgi:hydroxymethylpyrimidine pyrophosphatase-like HAD family hydrolase
VRALHAAARAGVHLSILTGRLYSGTRPSAEIAGVLGPVGCADGSHVVRASDHKTLMHHGLRGDHALRVRDALARNGPAAFVFAQDAIGHDARGEPYLGYVRTWSQDVRPARSVEEHEFWTIEDGVTAVVAVGTAEQIHGTGEDIERTLGASAQIATFPVRRLPDTWGLVARAAGGTKGSALSFIAAHHGCSPEETVCVGDWLNDVSMFEVAGRSFAMGQAPPEVKKAASDVLEETSEKGGGVARAIAEAFGIRADRE